MLLTQIEASSQLEGIIHRLLSQGAHLGLLLLKAFILYIVGRFLIKLVNKIVRRFMSSRGVESSVRSFLESLVNITLTVLLIISIIGVLGIQTTSFAALLAAVGVALGAALSGNLSNFAGGLVILLFKPYRVGDFVEAQSCSGTVKEIQIFHTVLTTSDNRTVFVPNGSMSSGSITNYNVKTRRLEWIIGVEYGTDFKKVNEVITTLLANDNRILFDPSPLIALHALADSSVNIVIRAWVKAGDYWNVYFDTNRAIYETFNQEGIQFPFPQLMVHKAEEA